MKRAILVLGPPRSGTSVCSHVLSKLGVDFGDPDRFVDSKEHKHNPIFFELKTLNEINDRVFEYFSRRYEHFDWLPTESDFSVELVEELEPMVIHFLENEFSGKTIGLKDPRFCFTIPFWEKILTRNGYTVDYVHTRRRSNSVYNSNRLINGLSDEVNFRLVAHSYLAVCRFVSAEKCVEVVYEELLASPDKVVRDTCLSLGLGHSLLPDALAVISQSLNHQMPVSKSSPLYDFFGGVIDGHHGTSQKYMYYRDIFLASSAERGKSIADELASKDEQLLQEQSRVAGLLDSIDEKNKILEQILLSRSWKLTRPLRLLKKLFK